MEYLKVLDTDSDEVKKAKQGLIAAKDAAVEEAKKLAEKGAFKPDSEEFKNATKQIAEEAIKNAKIEHGDKEVTVQEFAKSIQGTLDEFFTKHNRGNQKVEKKTFGDSFGSALEEKSEEIRKFSGLTSGKRDKMDLTLELKDVDFDSFSTGLYDRITTEFRPGVYQSPFMPTWLRNILPNASTTSKTIDYIQENLTANATDGAVDIWDGDPVIASLADKPDVGFNFEEAEAKVEWIAGILRIKREMLDDVQWLRSYIPQQLVYGRRGILVRENALVMSILDANSTPYDNRKSIAVEQIYDAAFGQLRDNYFAPTHILMNNRDVVDLILNKATGSGEYDLPPGTISYAAGRLTIGGIEVLALPQITAGEWYVMDVSQTQFISRLTPEVRFFEEDRDNVPKNLITIRAEERATALVYSKAAVIKGTETT